MKVKNPKVWTIKECKQCSNTFDVKISHVNRGGGKFCSLSCTTTYRNTHNNPTKLKAVREKISLNHADVSGVNNPMYGMRGEDAPSYIDGRNKFTGEIYRRIALANFKHECVLCGVDGLDNLDVHHKDGNNKNNELDNLVVLCKKCHRNQHIYTRDDKGRFLSAELNREVVL